MMGLRNSIIVVCFVIGNFLAAFGQEKRAKELLERASAYYIETPSYQVKTQYKMLKGLDGKEATESYDGYIIKNNDDYQVKIGNNLMLLNASNQLSIDHDQKIMLIKKAQKNVSNTTVNVQQLLESYQEASVKKEKNYYKCELLPKKGQPNIAYAKIILWIDSSSYELQRQEMYFSSQLPFRLEDGNVVMDFGRMMVEMSTQQETLKMDAWDVYIKKNSNGSFEVTDAYSNYKLIDETKQ